MNQYLVLAFLWILYFLLHSLLAANSIKKYVSSNFPTVNKYYRFIYSAFATLGLFAILVFSGLITKKYFFESVGIIRYVSLVLATFSVIIFKQAFKGYKFSYFIGLKTGDEEFVTTGILKHVRHPLYSATILLVLGYFLFDPAVTTLISAICIFIYLPIGIYLEEKKLIQQFGNRYLQYKKEVPALIPKFKK
jgi:protein-S-isoprenylcysteine O-methyltransferase Ste14